MALEEGFWEEGVIGNAARMNAGLISKGLIADLPSYGYRGRLFWATDEGIIYRDTGTAWEVQDYLLKLSGSSIQLVVARDFDLQDKQLLNVDWSDGLEIRGTGDYPTLHDNSTARTIDSDSYTKVKETKITTPMINGARFKFDYKQNTGGAGPTVSAYLAKNGAQIGAIYTTNDDTSYVTVSQDLATPFAVDDLLQIYAKRNSSPYTGEVRNLQVEGYSLILQPSSLGIDQDA